MLETSLIGLLFGSLGTTLGGIIGIFSKKNSNRFLSFVLSITAGLMLSIVCFNLIPNAISISDILLTVFGIILGAGTMLICDSIVKKIFKKKEIRVRNNKNSQIINNNLLKIGIIVSLGIALHNIPEGLAIGSGFDTSEELGLTLAIAICLHDIPEGLSMAVPLKNGGMGKIKIIIYVILSGVATGIGTLIGAVIGNISNNVIAMSLAFAAGAMLYIVSGELIPEYNTLHKGRLTVIGSILGFILGMFAWKSTNKHLENIPVKNLKKYQQKTWKSTNKM